MKLAVFGATGTVGSALVDKALAAAWPADDRARLIDIKQAWDPANLFRLGHALVGGRQPALR